MQSIQCISCKHYKFGNTCKAFKIIPEEIILGQVIHDKPIDGDNGIQYERSESYQRIFEDEKGHS